MIFRDRAWKFDHDVDTNIIVLVKYRSTPDPEDFAKHCLEGIDSLFPHKDCSGDIIVTDTNFGYSSSRKPAPLAIKTTGISCIIAKSFTRICYRNAFSVGLFLLESKEISSDIKGDELEVSLNPGEIRDATHSKCFQAKPTPAYMPEWNLDCG
jgi:3-isopropylmalate/(R)-2-methylmalate dehydratase small subunit